MSEEQGVNLLGVAESMATKSVALRDELYRYSEIRKAVYAVDNAEDEKADKPAVRILIHLKAEVEPIEIDLSDASSEVLQAAGPLLKLVGNASASRILELWSGVKNMADQGMEQLSSAKS